MRQRPLILLLIVMAFNGDGRLNLQAQTKNPLVGGVWERYSFRNAQGVETGNGPGWFFLVFTEDGNFFITGVPKGREKLPKPTMEMTKDELLNYVDGINARRGTYALTGNGSPYSLRLTEEVNALSPNLNNTTLEVWIENGEARVGPPGGGVVVRWRRVG